MRDREDEEHPHRERDGEGEVGEWLAEFLEPVYARLGPRREHERGEQEERERFEKLERPDGDESIFEPGLGKKALAQVPRDYWHGVKREWAERLLRHRTHAWRPRPKLTNSDLPAAGVPGENNWVPIGPSVVRRGQASGNPPISGRVSRLAIAPGGNRVYAATADGGVWRSDDAGATWRPTMDGFDQDPTSVLSTSNTCGAIAIDAADPDRVYVGTGEGDVDETFGSRLLTSLPAYRGRQRRRGPKTCPHDPSPLSPRLRLGIDRGLSAGGAARRPARGCGREAPPLPRGSAGPAAPRSRRGSANGHHLRCLPTAARVRWGESAGVGEGQAAGG